MPFRPPREMPASRPPNRIGQLIWWLLVGIGLLCLYQTISKWSLLVVVSLVAAAWVSSAIAMKRERIRLKGIADERIEESICQFARSFASRSVDTWVIRAVYETLQKELEYAHPSFPVRASDRLKELLADDDDLDMAVGPEIERRTGRALINCEENPYFGKISTVTDLVLFFNAQPKAIENEMVGNRL